MKIKISTMVTTADNNNEPKQPNRFEKKKNNVESPFPGIGASGQISVPDICEFMRAALNQRWLR